MKTQEMIKALSENQNKKFKRVIDGLEITCKNGYFRWKPVFDYLSIDDEWELVEESVIPEEAIKAWREGESFYIEWRGDTYRQPRGHKLGMFDGPERNGIDPLMFAEGKWYIED